MRDAVLMTFGWICLLTSPVMMVPAVKELFYRRRCLNRRGRGEPLGCESCAWAERCSKRPLTAEEAEELQRYIAELTAEWEEQ